MNDLRSKLIVEFLKNEDYAYAYYNDFLNVLIATQIKVIREQRGFETQSAFERATGIKQEQMSRLESIDNNSWTVNTLRRVARALGVTVKVSFEDFGGAVETIAAFGRRDALQRPTRVDALTEKATPQFPHATIENVAMTAVYQSAKLANQPPENWKRDDNNETSARKPSKGSMALSLAGLESERKGSGEIRPN